MSHLGSPWSDPHCVYLFISKQIFWGCFHFWATVENDAVNICIQVSVWTWSGVELSGPDNSMCNFSFLFFFMRNFSRNGQIVFYRGCLPSVLH